MSLDKKNIILETKKLSIGYLSKRQTNTIISEIDLTVSQGKLIALLGKNGIGKSTLLRTLSKVQQPVSGDILIQNSSLANYSQTELAKILSVVLTERLPESQLSVFEIVALGRQPYTNWLDRLSITDIKKIQTALDLTAITHLKDKPFHQLSDGQLQRVLIARALAQDTEIIILDEPTAHLDIHHTYKVFSLLKDLVKNTNKTIIISTHEVNLAIQLADEFILLTEKQVFNGNTSSLIDQNAFSELFPSENISFNKELQQFVINKN
ncbi:ABC transporter ATP-binding protein [Tenacibaculum jejuense]|uniref:ATP-binding protein of ferrichrome ABC transporter n=1 Tax=Tenacibaculum jejuense TaxID=584609 RepID=A0A238UEH2_9FLAO|nr:ABC transporter ATP-binding protein [Tenacibaculum jejuense]SNR16874.1 ATP-binding protein of ferrichrome ABC transporter [Tenacibaculum jejuense]